jgi:hypothetical protein
MRRCTRETGAAEPLLVTKCFEPKGTMISLLEWKIEEDEDAITGQSYTIVLYRPDSSGEAKALVISDGPNKINEAGRYRIYGSDDEIIVDIPILYDEATWTYSLFPREHLLFIHSTKTGIVGNPTAHLLAAACS